jgi:chromate transporter
MPGDAIAIAARVPMKSLVRVFGLIGLTSLGGGVSGWLYREVVEQRHWLTATEFLTGLALARTLPGINVINLAIWIGYQLRGGKGAVTAACAVLAGPMLMIVAVARFYRSFSHSALAHQVLVGIVAAALGLSLSVGFKALRPATPQPFYAAIVVALFVGIGVLHGPLIPLVTTIGVISVSGSFLTSGPDEG